MSPSSKSLSGLSPDPTSKDDTRSRNGKTPPPPLNGLSWRARQIIEDETGLTGEIPDDVGDWAAKEAGTLAGYRRVRAG